MMGPVPTSSDNRRPSDGEINEDEDYEQDGWAVGFEVEMNGVGIEGQHVEDASTSGGEDDSAVSDDEDGDRYSGYQALSAAAAPDTVDTAQGQVNEDPEDELQHLPTSVQRDFQQVLSASSSVHLSDADFKIEHQPRVESLQLDDAKIDAIKSAMSGFLLPPANVPKWADQLSEKEWKEKLLERINTKQPRH